MRWSGVALDVPAQAAGLPLKIWVASCPELVPQRTDMCIYFGGVLVPILWSTRSWSHRGASPRCSSKGWTQPESFCSHKMSFPGTREVSEGASPCPSAVLCRKYPQSHPASPAQGLLDPVPWNFTLGWVAGLTVSAALIS